VLQLSDEHVSIFSTIPVHCRYITALMYYCINLLLTEEGATEFCVLGRLLIRKRPNVVDNSYAVPTLQLKPHSYNTDSSTSFIKQIRDIFHHLHHRCVLHKHCAVGTLV